MTATAKPVPAIAESDKPFVEKAMNEIRIASVATWKCGGCVMSQVNKFDSLGKAGIKEQDEIVAINGTPLTTEIAFLVTLGKLGVGAKPVFRVRRAGKDIEIPVELLKKRKLNFEIDEAQVDLERKIAPA